MSTRTEVVPSLTCEQFQKAKDKFRTSTRSMRTQMWNHASDCFECRSSLDGETKQLLMVLAITEECES